MRTISNLFSILAVLCVASASAEEPRTRLAFLAGVADYRHKTMENLDFPHNDVGELAKQLKRLGFDVTSITGENASRDKLKTAFSNFVSQAERLGKDDIVFVALSGHGQQLLTVEDDRREEIPFFCPYDAINKRPETMLSINWVIKQLDEKSGSLHNLLVIDACRNNPAKGKGVDGSTAKRIPRGVSILFSAKAGEKSWESTDDAIRHGVFTHFLLEGLRGKARNRRDRLTWGSLVEYVRGEVPLAGPRIAGGEDRVQNPHFVSNKDRVTILDLPRTHAMPKKPYISRSSGIVFTVIPAGEFMMGSPESEVRRVFEHQHRVAISRPFLMGIHEVTQSQYARVMGSNPSHFAAQAPSSRSSSRGERIKGLDTRQFPVENVSWFDAVEFCNRLSERDGRAAYYELRDVQRKAGRIQSAQVRVLGGSGYHLPTEAQWEYACRAGTDTPFSFGSELDGSQANCNGTSPYGTTNQGNNLRRPAPVGSHAANRFGLFDMHGNIMEWCQDFYDRSYYQSSPPRDPTGPLAPKQANPECFSG